MPQLVAYLTGLFHQVAAAMVTAWTWTGSHWYLGLAAVAGALIVGAVLAPRSAR